MTVLYMQFVSVLVACAKALVRTACYSLLLKTASHGCYKKVASMTPDALPFGMSCRTPVAGSGC